MVVVRVGVSAIVTVMVILKKMKWQDMVFSAGEIVFMVSLFPSLLSDHKPAALTSLATGLMLCGFLTVHASYKLWTAFVLCATTALLWFVLAGQVIFA